MDHHRHDRQGAAVLLLLVAFSLMLAFLLVSDAPDPTALAQEGASNTPTFTPLPPVTSPRSTPTFTATPRPAPVPHPIEFITNPTEAYVLSQRYFRNRGRGDAQGADASEPQLDGGEAQPMHAPEARSLYLPLIRRDVGPLAWYKGAGQGIQYLQRGGLTSCSNCGSTTAMSGSTVWQFTLILGILAFETVGTAHLEASGPA
ncbi:MAG TPA: hypothetical protein PKM78_15520 [Anaerolineae bacterium]|nr:hypothetical protein [Anaerolineae bacterium]HNU05536.1 hypothetical protein [Anaerolineae bacterium]